MADITYQTLYRNEFIKGFEKRQSLLRQSVVTDTQLMGEKRVFLVADSGNATAVKRGRSNGDIPARPDNQNQYTVTLEEFHDVVEKTGFDIFAAQGDQRAIMQMTSMAVINRTIDDNIRAELVKGTKNWGVAAAATLPLILTARADLARRSAAKDAPVYGLITPKFEAQLMNIEQFASADYVQRPGFDAPKAGMGGAQGSVFTWLGITWMVDEDIQGVGTNDAKCFLYSRNAVGHACDMETMQTEVGYDGRHQRSWARCTTFMGTKLLQDNGIVQMPHNDNAAIS